MKSKKNIVGKHSFLPDVPILSFGRPRSSGPRFRAQPGVFAATLLVLMSALPIHAADTAGKPPVKVPSATATTISAVQGTVKPEPEAAIVMPKLNRRNEVIFIVHRQGGNGSLQANGYDTLVYSFNGSATGSLTEAIVSERRLGGLAPSRVFSFARSGEEILITMASEGMSAEYAVAKAGATGIEVRGEGWTRSYAKSPKGVISLQSIAAGQTVAEEWKSTGKEAYRRSEGDSAIVAGGYSLPDKGMLVYTERPKDGVPGAQDTVTSLWVEKDETRFRTAGGPVAAREVYASGLGAALTNDCALENMALVDTVLGQEHGMMPVMVWLNLRYKSGK